MDVTTGVPAVDSLLVWGGALSLLLGVGTGVWRVIRAGLNLYRRTSQFLDDWYGEPARPGVPARPGLLERVRGMETRVGQVWHEVFPNGGASLRDAVDRVADRLAVLCPGAQDTPQPPGTPGPPVLPHQPEAPDDPAVP